MKKILLILNFIFFLSNCSDIAYDDVNYTFDDPNLEKSSIENRYFKLSSNLHCKNPCQIYVEHSLTNLVSVEYFADNWKLGTIYNIDENFAISYQFNTLGRRLIKAIAYDSNGLEIARHSNWFQIYKDDISKEIDYPEESNSTLSINNSFLDVPYFYQYNNLYYPSATCQNTSIAMVLKNYGWSGKPDNITAVYGKNYTQSPAGLADVFNTLSSREGLSKKIIPITNGTLSGLKQELDKGQPVIIHGYFTRAGHVVVVVGYDADGYWVNDPAGVWVQTFMGGYGYNSAGKATYYKKQTFEAAVASDGYSYLPLWYHVIRNK